MGRHNAGGLAGDVYPYAWASHFKTETIGFSGQTGARATITLPQPDVTGDGVPHELVLEAINGITWKAETSSP